MQVFLLLYQLKLEAGADRLVLQTVIILNIVYQLLEQITAVVDLKQACVLLLVGVAAGDLMLHATPMVILVVFTTVVSTAVTRAVGRWILGVEEAAWGLHLLIEV